MKKRQAGSEPELGLVQRSRAVEPEVFCPLCLMGTDACGVLGRCDKCTSIGCHSCLLCEKGDQSLYSECLTCRLSSAVFESAEQEAEQEFATATGWEDTESSDGYEADRENTEVLDLDQLEPEPPAPDTPHGAGSESSRALEQPEAPSQSGRGEEAQDIEYDEEDYRRALEKATGVRPRPLVRALPWETGFLASVFGEPARALEPVELPPMPRPAVAVPQEISAESSKVAVQKLRFGKDETPWLDKVHKDRQRALLLWATIARLNPTASTLGLQMAAADDQSSWMILTDTLESKATKTMLARAYAVLMYVRWHYAHFGNTSSPFPFHEPVIYAYRCFLRSSKAPATRVQSMMQAMGFCIHVIGMVAEQGIENSARLKGASISSFMRKRELVQRNPLTTAQVQRLETLLVAGHFDPVDEIYVGFALFMTHCRMRFSDSQQMSYEPVVNGEFLECSTSVFKTANTTKRRRVPLPVVGLAQGLQQAGWAEYWLEARRRQGLVAGGGNPMMPRPRSTGGWTRCPISNAEANVWLLFVLRNHAPAGEALVNVGTHSCKATGLSWAAKAGLPVEDRLKLGSHVSKISGSADIYARDVLASPMRALAVVYRDIQEGRFLPDSDRSGMWKAVVSGSDSLGMSDSESSATEGAEDSDENQVAAITEALVPSVEGLSGPRGVAAGNSLLDFEGMDIFKHEKSHYFHIGREQASGDQSAKMRCGRRSKYFVQVTANTSILIPKCTGCFGHKDSE